jgi:hypothetical protein
MSQAGRAAHYHNQARHSQRVFGTEKPKSQPVGSDTVWVPEFLASLGDIGQFSANSITALPLGDTREERERKLRKATSLGALHMTAHRENGVFVEYRWELETRR